MSCHEVAAEHQAAPPTFKADYEVPAVRSVDCDGRCERPGGFGGLPEPGEGLVDDCDDVWEVARCDGVVRDVAAHNLGDETRVDRFSFRHLAPPPVL